MNDLGKRFTKVQIEKLESVGFGSIYDVLTFFPLGVEKILPLQNPFQNESERSKFLWEGELEEVEQKYGKNNFLILGFRGETFNLRAYFFSKAKFVLKTLKTGQSYQILLKKSKSFWVVEKLAILNSDYPRIDFPMILGRAKMKSYLQTHYSKKGILHPPYFKNIFSKLKREDFVLNLEGLVPDNNLIPKTIDLYEVHYPTSYENYKKTLDEWTSFKVFLRLSLMKFLDSQKDTRLAKESELDLDFLKRASSNLPFDLSISQKQAVWEVLQEVC